MLVSYTLSCIINMLIVTMDNHGPTLPVHFQPAILNQSSRRMIWRSQGTESQDFRKRRNHYSTIHIRVIAIFFVLLVTCFVSLNLVEWRFSSLSYILLFPPISLYLIWYRPRWDSRFSSDLINLIPLCQLINPIANPNSKLFLLNW